MSDTSRIPSKTQNKYRNKRIKKCLIKILRNKNVSSLIIEYLTDPPRLPFLEELLGETLYISCDVNQYWYHNNHRIKFGYNMMRFNWVIEELI